MKTKMYISCMLALMLTAAAWAAEGPKSPQSQTTAGLNGTEADKFMNLTGWRDVKFDKIFTYAGFARNSNEPVLDFGAAFKAGPVYIGAWYQGNLGHLLAGNNKNITTKITESTLTPGTVGTKKTTEEPVISKSHTATHNVAVLLGFGNMGVRLGYERSLTNKSGHYYDGDIKSGKIVKNKGNPEQIDETTYDPKGYINNAVRKGNIDFGIDLSLGSLSLTPTVGLAVDVTQSSQYGAEIKKQGNTLLQTQTDTKTVKGSNKTKTGLQAKLNADLGLNDSLHSTFSFGYEFGIDIYGKKKHTAADGTKKVLSNGYDIVTDSHTDVKNGTKHNVTDTFAVKAYTNSNIKNTINLGYSMQKDFTDRLSFFAGIEAPIDFNFEKTVTEQYKTEKTVLSDTADSSYGYTRTMHTTQPTKTVKTTTVTLKPVLKAALTYAAIPDRLFVSFGTDVKPVGSGCEYKAVKTTVNAFTNTTTTTITYNNGTPDYKDSKETSVTDGETESYHKTVSYQQASANVNLGIRWNIIDAVSFDAMYSKPFSASIGNLKLACTIKF